MSKLELANVSITTRLEDFRNDHPDDRGRIPDKLAEATLTLLRLHRDNGDLAWVADMIQELEAGHEIDTKNIDSPGGNTTEESLSTAIYKLLKDAPTPDEKGGLYAGDVIDAALSALTDAFGSKMVAEQIIETDRLWNHIKPVIAKVRNE